MPSLSSVVIAVLLFDSSSALYSAKGSPCNSDCDTNSAGTFWPDLVCQDEDFSSVTKGKLLQSCMTCMSTSTYVNTTYADGNADQYWLMFHMKYVQQYCIFDATTKIAAVNTCATECAPLDSALGELWINSHPFKDQYDYCADAASSYPEYAGKCADCLRGQKGGVIVGNFMHTMSNACANKPRVTDDNELVTTDRDLFDKEIIPYSASSSSSSASSSAATPTPSTARTPSVSSTQTPASSTDLAAATTTQTGSNATSTPTGSSLSSGTSSGSMSLSSGATLGIGLGFGIVGIASVVSVVVFFLLRRRSPPHTYSTPGSSSSSWDHNKGQGQGQGQGQGSGGIGSRLGNILAKSTSKFSSLASSSRISISSSRGGGGGQGPVYAELGETLPPQSRFHEVSGHEIYEVGSEGKEARTGIQELPS